MIAEKSDKIFFGLIDVKLLRVENNQKSIEFEEQMHGKIAILIA